MFVLRVTLRLSFHRKIQLAAFDDFGVGNADSGAWFAIQLYCLNIFIRVGNVFGFNGELFAARQIDNGPLNLRRAEYVFARARIYGVKA